MYLQVIFNKLKNDLQNKDYYIQNDSMMTHFTLLSTN